MQNTERNAATEAHVDERERKTAVKCQRSFMVQCFKCHGLHVARDGAETKPELICYGACGQDIPFKTVCRENKPRGMLLSLKPLPRARRNSHAVAAYI